MEYNEQSVRQEVRSFLEQNWNPEASLLEWRNILVDSGWGVPSWPSDWFGKDVPISLLPVVNEEFDTFEAIHVARKGAGQLAAATILTHGTDVHRNQYLRHILTGETTWCQLFSEPGSGSDLAGATTRAVLEGDTWIVNGQKVWTTSAHHADYGFLLARTNPDVPKHQGLSMFLIDMRQPGIEVKPLKQMNGHASFNEVFFTNAVIPREQMLDTEGNGWQIATTTLMHERRFADSAGRKVTPSDRSERIYQEEAEEIRISNEPYTWYPQRAGRTDLILERARTTGCIDDPAIRQDIARLLSLNMCVEWTAARAKASQAQGKTPGPEGSLGKLASSVVAREANRVHTLISGTQAMLTGPESAMQGVIAEVLVSTPAISIAGGTDEIQKNIISERVLGMPKELRIDVDIPFRQVKQN